METNLINRHTSNPQKLYQMLNAQSTFLNEVYTKKIRTGDVLLTIRPRDCVTAYHMGCQLFTIKNIIKHPDPCFYRAYLPVIRSDVLRERIDRNRISNKKAVVKTPMTESDWQKAIGKQQPLSGVLPEILENLKVDSGLERNQVSLLYKFSPLVDGYHSDVVLLDIEVEFSKSGSRSGDRIDAVLYHTDRKQLMLLEVKRLSDRRLQINKTVQSGVINQLDRYKTIINDQKDNIIKQYNNVIDTYNVINPSRKRMHQIDPSQDIQLCLLILEYSDNDYPLLSNIKAQLKQQNKKAFSIGKAKSITSRTLARWFNN